MIRQLVVPALVAASLYTGVVAPQAMAQSGFLCGFTSEYDPTLEGDTQTGEMDGGPLFAADTDNPGEEAARISITCTIQVGAQGATHAGADSVSRTSPAGDGVAVLPPQIVSYVSPRGAPVYLCTQAAVSGQTRYWDADDEDDPTDFVGWTTSITAGCVLAIYQDTPVDDLLRWIFCTILPTSSSESGARGGRCPPYPPLPPCLITCPVAAGPTSLSQNERA